jgi:hypothetical protein
MREPIKPGAPVAPEPGRARRAYAKPELIEYGPVAKLTQGTKTVGNDGPMGGFKRMGRGTMMCL